MDGSCIAKQSRFYFSVKTVFPLVSIIFIILALRAIGSDEALVQSYNRLRSGKKK